MKNKCPKKVVYINVCKPIQKGLPGAGLIGLAYLIIGLMVVLIYIVSNLYGS